MNISEWQRLKNVAGLRSTNVVSDPLKLTLDCASKLYKCLNTPVALSCFLLLQHGDFDALVSKKIHPLDYNDLEMFRKDYLAVKFLAKCAGLPTTHNVKLNALKNEAQGEAQCYQTNKRLTRCFPDFNVNLILNRAQDIICDILGDTPSIEEISLKIAFGPGATSATSGFDTTHVAKLDKFQHSTSKAKDDLNTICQTWPMLDPTFDPSVMGPWIAVRDSNILECNSYTSVPKNAITDRGIAIPVSGVGLGQKALGGILRERLKAKNIDLDSLWTLNQHYAMLGSRNNKSDPYVTIDLSNASSTISVSLVERLLPRSWFLLLDRWRETYTDYGDLIPHENGKFSAMGNAYTFELESLLFYALVKATQKHCGYDTFCSSFGDDIICHRECVPLLTSVFTWCGLTVNSSKSFTSGYFRESCGGDFWNGSFVTPFYLKDLLRNENDVIKLANRLRYYSARIRDNLLCDVQLRPLWHGLIDRLRKLSPTLYIGDNTSQDDALWVQPGESGTAHLLKPTFAFGQWWWCSIGTVSRKRKRLSRQTELNAWYFGTARASAQQVRRPYDTTWDFDRLIDCLDREYVSNPRTTRGTLTGKRKVRMLGSSVMTFPPNWG